MKLRKLFMGLATTVLALLPASSALADTGTQNYYSLPLGSVIANQTVTLNAELSAVATGKRILYISSNPSGDHIVVSGLALTPKPTVIASHPLGAGKIVAWAHGTEGMADFCAPSAHSNLDADPSYPYYSSTVAGYLGQGWTVAASDYPGLGTSGTPPYLVGASEGRAVIDSVRAVRNLNPLLSNKWVVSGHSQGGQAALFASQLAASYGGGLSLKGAVAIAPVSNLDLIAQSLPGTPGNGYGVMGVYGLAALDPSVNPSQVLAAPALAQVGVLSSGCAVDVLTAYSSFSATDLLVGGQFSASMIAKFAASNPAQQASGSPVLLVQGDADQTVPVDLTYLLDYQECSINSQPTQLNVYPGQDHDPVLSASAGDVLNYIAGRFANQPAPSNCQ